MVSLMQRRREMMRIANAPVLSYVTDGLVLSYTLDTADWDTLKWSDSCNNGADITIDAANKDARYGMPHTNGGNSAIVTAAQFNSLCPGSFSIETSSWIGANNFIWSFAAGKAESFFPQLLAYRFADSSNNMIPISRNYLCRHIIVTYDAASNLFSLYLSGVRKESQIQKTSTISANAFRICGWGGNMGTVRVYQKCLSAAEVLQNFKYESQKFTFTD